MRTGVKIFLAVIAVFSVSAILTASFLNSGKVSTTQKSVPHEEKYGIYALDLTTKVVSLIYSTSNEIFTSSLRLNSLGDEFVFSQKIDGTGENSTEIFTIDFDGKNLRRLTNNLFWDLYPAWSPGGGQIAFLSMREEDLDIYVMNSDGGGQHKLYDSGSHDADIDWVGDVIVFTSGFRIWRLNDDGTGPAQVTNPLNAGQWGNANLPIGDYDPRLRSDGKRIVFERLEDPGSEHGSYNIFAIDVDGHGETRLTSTGYSQGLASWSHSGDRIVYVVAAIGNVGKYDIYMMNADGTDDKNITPDYFPPEFLCHSPIFSVDDSKIYFIGQWMG